MSLARELFQSLGAPDHSVSWLSWSRSLTTPPKSIAPKRPLPIGRASTHCSAGWRYQSVSSLVGWSVIMVLSVFCVPFVRPAGRTNGTQDEKSVDFVHVGG